MNLFKWYIIVLFVISIYRKEPQKGDLLKDNKKEPEIEEIKEPGYPSEELEEEIDIDGTENSDWG